MLAIINGMNWIFFYHFSVFHGDCVYHFIIKKNIKAINKICLYNKLSLLDL